MDISFENPSILSAADILMLEKKIGTQFPIELKDFLKKHSNSVPKINGNLCCFKIFHGDGWEQDSFIEKICTPEKIVLEFENRETLNLYVSSFDLQNTFVEVEYLFPLAFASNGILYYSIGGMHTGKVFYADNGDFGILLLSNSFDNFWNSVQ